MERLGTVLERPEPSPIVPKQKAVQVIIDGEARKSGQNINHNVNLNGPANHVAPGHAQQVVQPKAPGL